jgi:hypothetical protein
MPDTLLESAKAVLNANWNGHFTKPAPNLYPHQWNWDAGFIALGLAHYDMDRAEAELRALFRGQWATGMLPQIIFGKEEGAQYFPGPDFWQTQNAAAAPTTPITSGITMPPVHGFILWEIYQIAEDKNRAKAFLKELFPKVVHLHQYLYTHRDPLEEGLVYIRHPWESGTDNSPLWDEALAHIDPANLDIPTYQRKDLQNPEAATHRPTDLDYDRYVHLVDIFRIHQYDDAAIYEHCPFLIQDPLFNAILAWSNEALIEIGNLLKEDVSEIIQWNELTIYSMNEKLWDERAGRYLAYDLHNERLIHTPTISGIMPLIGEVPTQEQAERILQTLASGHFAAANKAHYLCPTHSLQADDIDFQKYWRGPVWINMNWMLYYGLRRYDFNALAEIVKQDSLELVREYGFYEYFDPRKNVATKTGYGTNQFSWSAALCIDFLYA